MGLRKQPPLEPEHKEKLLVWVNGMEEALVKFREEVDKGHAVCCYNFLGDMGEIATIVILDLLSYIDRYEAQHDPANN